MKKSMMLLSLSMILLSMTSCDNKYSLKLDDLAIYRCNFETDLFLKMK